MENLPFEYTKVASKAELEKLLFELLDHNDAITWSNDSVYSYLQSMAAWLHDAEEYYKNAGQNIDSKVASWQILGDMLQAASFYK